MQRSYSHQVEPQPGPPYSVGRSCENTRLHFITTWSKGIWQFPSSCVISLDHYQASALELTHPLENCKFVNYTHSQCNLL